MKQKLNFFDDINDWSTILTDTYNKNQNTDIDLDTKYNEFSGKTPVVFKDSSKCLLNSDVLILFVAT